jgi:hypothetical protein
MPFGFGVSTSVRFRTVELVVCGIGELEAGFESGRLVDFLSPGKGIIEGLFEGRVGSLLSRTSRSFEETGFEHSLFFSSLFVSISAVSFESIAGDEAGYAAHLLALAELISLDLAIISRLRGVSHSTILKATVPKTFCTKDR